MSQPRPDYAVVECPVGRYRLRIEANASASTLLRWDRALAVLESVEPWQGEQCAENNSGCQPRADEESKR